MAEVSANNAWLTILATIFPGLLLIYVYLGLIKKSTRPFPMMLEEHLGRLGGNILGLAYIFIFLIVTSFYLRFFIEFISNTALTNTPASLLLLVILLPGTYAIRCGIEIFARISELSYVVFLPLTLILLILSLGEETDIRNLMPVAYISMKNLSYAVYLNLWHFGNMMIVLTLAFFSDRNKLPRILIICLVSLVVFLSAAIAVSIITLGTALNILSTFPLFEIARSITLGGFIRNTEIIFVSIFTVGIFITIITFWMMTCYCTQQVFRLKDYRFLSAPTSIVIGFGAIIISPNTFTVFSILTYVAPLLFGTFFVAVPCLLYILLLFKGWFKKKTGSGQKGRNPDVLGMNRSPRAG